MVREIKEYKKPGSVYPEVVVMDVRDILHGDYSVERLVKNHDGYEMVYCHHDLQKCIDKAEKLFSSL